jgi:phenylacetate-coenzyme A ligase PaaK-like adenylate-forming protein
MTRSCDDGKLRIQPGSAADFLPPTQLRALQVQRLRATVNWAYPRVELYRRRME